MTSSRLGLFRQQDFLKLWSAETISQFGTQVSLLAVPTVAILVLQAPPFEVALLGTIEFLPFLLFALPAGVWVDRLRRRPILIVGDLGRAISLASIPIAYELGVLSIWQLYVVGFANGILTVFFDVAYQSYLPSLVERDHLVEGNSKLEVSRSAAQILGPGVAGGLIGIVTAPLAIIVDSLSFIGSAAFVSRIRRDEPLPERNVDGAAARGPSMREEIGHGLRYVLGHPYLRMIAGSTASSNLFSNLAFSLYLVYVYRVLGLDPATVGLIFGIGSIGTLVGALTANRIAGRIGVGPAIVGSIALSFPGALLVPLAPHEFPHPFLIGAAALGGFSALVYNINQVSFRQAITPERMQGRMNATMRFVVWGTIPIGNVIGGAIGSFPGLDMTTAVTAAMWIGAIGQALPPLFVLFSPVRRLHRMPQPSGDGFSIEEIAGASSRLAAPDARTVGEAVDEAPHPAATNAPLSRPDEDRS